jgi:hypothetical protein
MQRVRNILADMFERALGQYGQEELTLDGISIERISERFTPHLVAHFTNGHRASAPVPGTDLYAFSARHSAWDLESLRVALLREACEIYDQVLAQRRVDNRRRGNCSPTSDRLDADSDIRRDRRSFRQWLNRVLNRPPFFAPTVNRKAHARGMELLKINLAPAQREQYETSGYFDVIGGESGKRYRIKNGYQMNVEELDQKGRCARLLCFMPEGDLVIGDVMLAQKLALELFESEALDTANKLPPNIRYRAVVWG